MHSSRVDVLKLVFFIVFILFVSAAVIGAFTHYLPIPYWDEWMGSVYFYTQVEKGDYSFWWAQHNEHRIVLSRILFWMDQAWFSGRSWPLIVVNYLLLGLCCAVFFVIWREQEKPGYRFVGFFLVCWLFSWVQMGNLIWAFQSQFIFAQLLPLMAFYFLHKAASDDSRKNQYFIGAFVLAFLSIGSMANGILALPLLAVLTMLVGLGWRRAVPLALLSAITIPFYFYNYERPSGYGSVLDALSDYPLALIQYMLLYLGGPIYSLAKVLVSNEVALVVAQLSAVFLILSSAFFMIQLLRKPERSSLQFALLIFILYVGGTALGTAGGRAGFGLTQALSPRYMTPVLMAWAALVVLYGPWFMRVSKNRRWVVWAPALLVLGLSAPEQSKALIIDDKSMFSVFELKTAVLALELRIKDRQQIDYIYVDMDTVYYISEVPVERDLTVFGLPPFTQLREQIGTTLVGARKPASQCQGALEEVVGIPEFDTGYLKVRGWVFNPITQTVPEILTVVDADTSKIVGFVMTGDSRESNLRAARNAGFKGYMKGDVKDLAAAKAAGHKIMFVDQESGCQFTAELPVVR